MLTYDQWLYRLNTLKKSSFARSSSSSPFFLYSNKAIPGKLVDKMLRGRMGVFPAGDDGAELIPFDIPRVVASAIAVATGTFVSSRHPAGTQPCLDVSGSTKPDPAGSRCTTHHPRARERMMKVSPL